MLAAVWKIMNIHHLELFYFVARHGGISEAVRNIPYGIQQPAVSGQVGQLEEYLGVTPPDDTRGILQDIHWSIGIMGYFPTYSLGNLLSAQLWEKAVTEIPEIPAQIARGEFAPLLGWLRETIHRHGRKYLPNELIQRATGEPLHSRAYLRYLTEKYSELYRL